MTSILSVHSAARLAIVLLLSGSFLAAAGQKTSESPNPRVVTTNPILHDMVLHVGGDRVEAICLLPPGLDIHSFDPTPATIRDLTDADLLVINGFGLETTLDPILENADFKGRLVEAAVRSRLISIDPTDHDPLDDHDHHHGPVDPHAWQDLRNAVTYAEVIRDALIDINPLERDTYLRLTELYTRELLALDSWTRRQLLNLPAGSRSILVSHQGLEYFGRAYGLKIVSVVGLSPYQDPDARQISAIIDDLRARRIQGIFVEYGSNQGVIRQIARESGIPVGETLYTGTLGSPGELSATFTGMFALNVIRILRILDPEAATLP
ncbi:MAG: zinc ABC transporter substrate-binding protein [Opitutaceae bacterium]